MLFRSAGANRTAPCDALYTNLQISPLKLRWLMRILCLTFQCVKGMRPSAVNNLFHQPQHRYSTRGQSSSVLPRRAAHVVARRSFSFRASLLWNSLSYSVRDVSSLSEFKCSLSSLSPQEVDALSSIAFSTLCQ